MQSGETSEARPHTLSLEIKKKLIKRLNLTSELYYTFIFDST